VVVLGARCDREIPALYVAASRQDDQESPMPRPDRGMRALVAMGLFLAVLATCPRQAGAQQAQNPSPMVEHTREHPRLAETRPPGRREPLELGTLFVPARLVPKPGRTGTAPLLVVFHAGDRIIAIDGIHTDYVDGKPGPLESRLGTTNLAPWLAFAREAMAGRKALLVLHTEIFPGTFASTTETADWLIRELGLRRRAVARWGPMGMVLLSDTRAGRLRIQGYAGNSAPDHVDLLHALPDWLQLGK